MLRRNKPVAGGAGSLATPVPRWAAVVGLMLALMAAVLVSAPADAKPKVPVTATGIVDVSKLGKGVFQPIKAKARKGRAKARASITVGWYLPYCRCAVGRNYAGPRHTSFEAYMHARDCGGAFNDNCNHHNWEQYSDGYQVYDRYLYGLGWAGASHSRFALFYPYCRSNSLSAQQPDRGCYQAWGT